MTDPSVTVITVGLNAAGDLPLTIESVLGQTWPHIEYIVADGLSWDGTAQVLGRYAGRIDRIVRNEDAGIYDAMNRAAAQAQGDYVLFLNAGDCFHAEDAVEAVFSRLDEPADAVYGDHIHVAGGVEQFQAASDFDWLADRLRRGVIDERWHRHIPCHQATFVRTAALRAMPYDTRYRICADHDWLWRAHAAGLRLRYVDEIVARYAGGGLSQDGSQRILREWAHSYRRFCDWPARVDRLLFGSASLSPWHVADAARYDPGAYEPPPCLEGQALEIAASALPGLKQMLAEGWSAPECEIGLVWSIAAEALLVIALAQPARQLTLHIKGNPHVGAAGQQVTVLVNGQPAGAFHVTAAAQPAACQVAVGGVWQAGANVVGLQVDRQARPPADSRDLGVALCGLSWG